MSCPPGTVLNPRTLRCVKLTGRIAQQLVREGSIADIYAPMPAAPRTTVRRKRANAGFFGFGAPRNTVRNRGFGFGGFGFGAPAEPELRLVAEPTACPPGTERNPLTGRCIKLGGRVHKRVHGPPPAPPAPAPAPLPVIRAPIPAPLPVMRPVAPAAAIRRSSSEAPPHLPVGMSGAVPLGDRRSMLGWLTNNCENDRDPLTGQRFATASPEYLQQAIRLHQRTCTTGPALDAKVSAEHRAGNVATIPGDPSTHMTLEDFKALRSSMRRRDPAYKIPARKHQPPPANWQLYIASDNRSGPEYASVMFLDVTKAEQTSAGVQYPTTAVRMDLGFIPVTETAGASCSPQTLVDLIQNVNEKNRLVSPVAGGWKPNAGFPFKKSYWEKDRAEKVSRLCRDLAVLSARAF